MPEREYKVRLRSLVVGLYFPFQYSTKLAKLLATMIQNLQNELDHYYPRFWANIKFLGRISKPPRKPDKRFELIFTI